MVESVEMEYGFPRGAPSAVLPGSFVGGEDACVETRVVEEGQRW